NEAPWHARGRGRVHLATGRPPRDPGRQTPEPRSRSVSPRSQTDALRGSIDLLILKTLSLGPMHGWGISQRIQEVSTGVLELNQGSLYPALQRLEREGLITSAWGTTENNRRARYYEITAAGQWCSPTPPRRQEAR